MLAPTDTSDRPFALPPRSAEVTVDLPFPPSVNRTRRAHGKGMRILDKWKRQADLVMMVTCAGARRGFPRRIITHAYEAHIVISEKHGGIDLDNGIKAIIDYAVTRELIPGDEQKYLRRLIVEWGDAPEGCRLTLRSMGA